MSSTTRDLETWGANPEETVAIQTGNSEVYHREDCPRFDGNLKGPRHWVEDELGRRPAKCCHTRDQAEEDR